MNSDIDISASLDESGEDYHETAGTHLSQTEDLNHDEDLDASYRARAEDEEQEAEALEWIEGTIGDS